MVLYALGETHQAFEKGCRAFKAATFGIPAAAPQTPLRFSMCRHLSEVLSPKATRGPKAREMAQPFRNSGAVSRYQLYVSAPL